jgi:predicted site-specific integrase-resolvase
MPFMDKYDEIEQGDDRLLTLKEVAYVFRVDPKTVIGWASSGKLNYVLTPGGQRRFFEKEVLAKAAGNDG